MWSTPSRCPSEADAGRDTSGAASLNAAAAGAAIIDIRSWQLLAPHREGTTTLGFPSPLLAVPCLGIAAVWLVVWPRLPVTGAAWVVLRYFHSLAWVWMAVAVVLADVSRPAMWIVLALAGLTYAAWFAVLVRASKPPEA